MHIISYCPKTSNQKNPTGDRFIFACKMWINEQLFVKNHFTWSTLDSFSSPVMTWTSFRSTLLSRFAWYSRADSSSVCPVRAADKPIKYVHVNHFFCSIHLTLAVISFNISNNHPAAVVQGLTNNITPKLEITWFVSSGLKIPAACASLSTFSSWPSAWLALVPLLRITRLDKFSPKTNNDDVVDDASAAPEGPSAPSVTPYNIFPVSRQLLGFYLVGGWFRDSSNNKS